MYADQGAPGVITGNPVRSKPGSISRYSNLIQQGLLKYGFLITTQPGSFPIPRMVTTCLPEFLILGSILLINVYDSPGPV